MPAFFTGIIIAMLLSCPVAACPPQAPPAPATGIRITPDILYAQRGTQALGFDVYAPANPNGAGVVFINSGGYVSPACVFHAQAGGDPYLLDDGDLTPVCRQASPQRLLADGFTVFNLRHGNAPDFTLEDMVAAVRGGLDAIRSAAPCWGVDATRIGLWGASAGGHMALLLGSRADSAAHLAAVVAYFPPTDLETLVTPKLQQRYPALDLPVVQQRRLSPLHHAGAGDPPTLIIHGERDTLVPLEQGQLMHERLQAAGVPARLLIIPDAAHGFTGRDADLALAQSLAWFRQYLSVPNDDTAGH